MSDQKPPPIPPSSPGPWMPPVDTTDRRNQKAYNIIADKIGGLPNVRAKDNLYQAIAIAAIAAFVALGSLIGWFRGGWPGGVIAGGVCGMVVALLLSGAVLAVIGLVRKP